MSAPPPVLEMLGVPVHAVTYRDTLSRFAAMIASGAPHQVCTVNPEFVMAAQGNPAFMAVLRQSALNLPDGQGLLWAARLRGQHLPERVAGSTLVWQLATQAAAQGWCVYLLGAGPGVAMAAAERLRAHAPGLMIVTDGADPHEADEIVTRVREAQPDVLLVAYGAPKQDLWIAAHAGRLQVPVMMGVGGSLDFVAGIAVRAPRWMQRLGLEWLHRLWREPWRWRRMLALPRFAWTVAVKRNAIRKVA